MKLTFTYYDEEGGEEELSIPAKYAVCGRCRGTGKHDCWEGGMTQDEMDEQGPEFFEDYMSGMYDRPCTECNGERVVLVEDTDRTPQTLLSKYWEMQEQEAAYRAEVEAERRMGA